MTPAVPGKVALVALNCGLPPHAEPLLCDDIRGPRSVFGESAKVPRPIKNWQPSLWCHRDASVRFPLYENSFVLWENRGLASMAARAERIAGDESYNALDVPASTFIAGKSASSFVLAWDLLRDGALPDWGGVLCSCQTAGRGQLGRHWHSPRGNLYVSFRLPQDPLLSGDVASLITGYIILTAFRALGFPLSLKWPNDLLLDEKVKVGGILLEERQGVLMAGLGVNLAEAPTDTKLREQAATQAGVLLPEHGALSFWKTDSENADAVEEPLAPFALWRKLVSEAVLAYIRDIQGRTVPELLTAIDGVLAWKHRDVILAESGEAVLKGCFLGLGPGGGLLLRLPHGEHREVFSGSLAPV